MGRKLCQWSCAAIVLAVVMLPSAVLAKKETHQFTLYKGKSHTDPYVQEYGITLEREGLIRVHLRVATADRKMEKPLVVGIANRLNRKLRTFGGYKSKSPGVGISHAVDSHELKTGRTYVVYVGNYSTKRNASGTIIIEYPAGPEEAKTTAAPPDLAVSRIWLNEECKVQVAVSNPGPTRLSPVYYLENVPDLYLYRNGKRWGGVTLAVLDPQKKLVRKGGRAIYSSNLKINGTEQIRAVIDSRNVLREKNEKNNAQAAKLTCKAEAAVTTPLKPVTVQAAAAGKPDLAVQSVRLTKECRVMVTLINRGPQPLPNSAWTQKTSPTLMLYRNGKSWGGANLVVIDPDRRLQSANGRARYVSNLKVAEKMNIKAVIDYHGILDEQDEINNAKEVALQCK